jgi:hypothetical protein
MRKRDNAFLQNLQAAAARFDRLVATDNGDWIVKGFIDVFKNVYTISGDTKVVSKVIELMLFPYFVEFADEHRYHLVLSPEQNFYPDLTFIDSDGCKHAVDLKSTYRTGRDRANTMTLGAFTAYFRQRESTKNTTFPYGEYTGHFVLGAVYRRAEIKPDERRKHSLEEIERIPSVVKDIHFFAQPKYRIAKDVPGSGNTKNIGPVNQVSQLLDGTGPFAELGEEVFDDYWMYYMTTDMARAAELDKPPYTNLTTYLEYKKRPEKRK